MRVVTVIEIPDTEYLKRCSRCKETKDATHFQKNRSNKDGLQTWCRSCQNAHTIGPGKCKRRGCDQPRHRGDTGYYRWLCVRHEDLSNSKQRVNKAKQARDLAYPQRKKRGSSGHTR